MQLTISGLLQLSTNRTIILTRADEDAAAVALLLQFLVHVTIDGGQAAAYARVIALLQRAHCPAVVQHLCLALERTLRQARLPRPLAFCLGALADDATLCAAALACDEPPGAPHAHGMLDLDGLPPDLVDSLPPAYLWLLARVFRRRANNKTSWTELAGWFEREAARPRARAAPQAASHAAIIKDNAECAYVTDDMRACLELALSSPRNRSNS